VHNDTFGENDLRKRYILSVECRKDGLEGIKVMNWCKEVSEFVIV